VGFYKKLAMEMREARYPVTMATIPRFVASRAATRITAISPVRRVVIMSNDTIEGDRNKSKDERPSARLMEEPIHKPKQDPDNQPSSRGGGGLKPSDAPVLLLHRRGRSGENMLADFQEEDVARAYAKEHKLMIVHSQRNGDQLQLFYLPE
jgi:hypothetical protein